MNTAAARVMSDSAAEPPIMNRIRKTRAFFRKLSLNAEKNWHQNSGAKRRDSKSGLVAAGDGSVMGANLCQKHAPETSLRRCDKRMVHDTVTQNHRGRTL